MSLDGKLKFMENQDRRFNILKAIKCVDTIREIIVGWDNEHFLKVHLIDVKGELERQLYDHQRFPLRYYRGDRVKFIGCSKDQINWGNNDDPNLELQINEVYEVENVEVHSQHTKLTLVGISGRFNSVCFERVYND